MKVTISVHVRYPGSPAAKALRTRTNCAKANSSISTVAANSVVVTALPAAAPFRLIVTAKITGRITREKIKDLTRDFALISLNSFAHSGDFLRGAHSACRPQPDGHHRAHGIG